VEGVLASLFQLQKPGKKLFIFVECNKDDLLSKKFIRSCSVLLADTTFVKNSCEKQSALAAFAVRYFILPYR